MVTSNKKQWTIGLCYEFFNMCIKISFQEASNIVSGLFLVEIQVFLFQ